ncbi:MAG TPA: CaiB/BaiF CoA-transferase family protein [Xanthobacteraceae bacterium]|nr:CaiB/BaiF CoA-transferase family protein [Xanthobacteraceae bacterium]
MTEAEGNLPLAGLRVLDLTLARAGPTCVRHLADWGADVIRIEAPVGASEDVIGKRAGSDFQNLHRNKRSLQLDLKRPEGHALFMRLAAKADVIVENMRPDVKHRLRVAWDDIHPVYPRIVYGSISGFGQDGPYHARAGVDQIAQGMGGMMSITGLPGQGPVRAGVAIADLTAGNLLALGIMMALYERTRTGVGRWVTTSLLEAQIFMLDFQAARWLKEGEVAGQAGNDHPTGIPTGTFPTRDGHINIAASSGRLWTRLCDVLGHLEWTRAAAWRTQAGRSADRAALNAAISALTREDTSANWIARFEQAGIPCGPIYAINEVFADPQVKHLGLAARLPADATPTVVASAISMSGTDKAIRRAPPAPSQDTDAILREIGCSAAEISALRENGTTP